MSGEWLDFLKTSKLEEEIEKHITEESYSLDRKKMYNTLKITNYKFRELYNKSQVESYKFRQRLRWL